MTSSWPGRRGGTRWLAVRWVWQTADLAEEEVLDDQRLGKEEWKLTWEKRRYWMTSNQTKRNGSWPTRRGETGWPAMRQRGMEADLAEEGILDDQQLGKEEWKLTWQKRRYCMTSWERRKALAMPGSWSRSFRWNSFSTLQTINFDFKNLFYFKIKQILCLPTEGEAGEDTLEAGHTVLVILHYKYKVNKEANQNV